MKRIFSFFLFALIFMNISAQEFSGTVKDSVGNPIVLANVAVLSKLDSTLIVGTTTDSNGRFSFEVDNLQDKFVVISFVGFKHYTTDLKNLSSTIVLQNDETYLQAVEVKAQRQLVHMDEGKLVYDAEVIREKKVVSSAFDVIVELPSLYTKDEQTITMVGGSTPKIIINGRVSTMNYSTLIDYLKALPAEKVLNVELAFSAPPEWFVGNGPAINVTIKKEKNYHYSGRIGGSYRNYTVNGTTVLGSGFFSSPKWDFFLSGSGGYYVNMSRSEKEIHHNVKGTIYDIYSDDFSIARNRNYSTYFSTTYHITDTTDLSLVYSGSYIPYSKSKSHSENTYLGNSKSKNLSDIDRHTVSLHYKHSNNFNLGVEYTNYNNDLTQEMQYADVGQSFSDAFVYDANQKINKFMSYFNISNRMVYGWTLSLGGNYVYTNNDNTQINRDLSATNTNSYKTFSNIEEHALSAYVSLRKRMLNGKLFASVTLTDEYYNNDGYEINDLLPNIQVTYAPNANHYLVFSNYNQREHPSYWNLQDYETHTNKYEVSVGNPFLKPSWANTTGINYYFKQKYQIGLFYIYCDPNLISTTYQRQDTLLVINEMVNQQKTQALLLNLGVPIEIGKRIISRFDGQLRWQEYEDDDWHGLNYKSETFSYDINNTTAFTLSFKPKIIFSIMTSYASKGPSGGLRKYTDYYSLSAKLTASFLNNRLSCSLLFNDILETRTPKYYIDTYGQNWKTNSNFYKRMVFLQVFYSFKGYKEIQQQGVDTSRFGM